MALDNTDVNVGERRSTLSPGGKGLQKGQVGLLAIVVMGVATVAPAYAITSSLGPTASSVGLQVPIVLLLGFIPMFMVSLAYKELNADLPDSGTTFTWASRAFGPWVGWMGGWGFLAANIIVLSNLAGVAVDFLYLFLADVTGNPGIAELGQNKAINIITCLVFMALAVWVSVRGLETTRNVQVVLLVFQVGVLLLYSAMAAAKAVGGISGTAVPFDWSWFDVTQIPDFGAFAAGMSLSIFLFWGWDMCLTMNEETKGGHRTAGVGATVTAIAILAIYLAASIASIMFAGVGAEGLGLGNEETSENVLTSLAGPVMGPLAILLSLAVLTSSASSLQATMVGPARTLQAMSFYKALPEPLRQVNGKGVPRAAVLAAGGVSAAFYVAMRILSDNVLNDTIMALGMMVCFYYAVTAFACFWYFRRTWFASARNVVMRLVLPLLGGLGLAVVFVQTAVDSIDPAFGSGSELGGVGLVFIVGVGILALGLVTMAVYRLRQPEFFRGQTVPVAVATEPRD
jgi:amino acid transporter